ncbi:hypothetical protein [Burkholderia vietnamiensis]|uniref:hypothetical protein n=1 Tax=Burkholderia vietnamiensis TaxID=60552 RepID=UPI001CF0E081|nr:hypothetical protein [Burkholderia vietnamiensis]MCA8183715.1 hypothetical protein [Burkholderia vietnamiensis]
MDESFIFPETESDQLWITSPSGRNLSYMCTKDTTIFSDESVKSVNVPEKYTILKITTDTTGYTLQKVYGHPNVSSTWKIITEHQPAFVVPTYRAILTLFDSSKEEANRTHYNINVTRDAWYYLGKDNAGATWCRNIAFEPADANKNRYLTEQIHFPSAAADIIHGYFLMENESQRGHTPRLLHAEKVINANPYGSPIPLRKDESIASNVMFHIGGFYEASAQFLHAKWLGGSEGCVAFIPEKSIRSTPEDAARITLETGFFSNKTWVNLTALLERYRDSDPHKRFYVEIKRRPDFVRDEKRQIFSLSGAVDDTAKLLEAGYGPYIVIP